MGAWGFSILENDASADAYSEYVDAMNAGLSHAEAVAKVQSELSEMFEDEDDAAYGWLGIARGAWEYGNADAALIRRIEKIATSDAHLSEWDDAGPKGREKRKKILGVFVAKLKSKNPKPRKPRKARLRQPIYEPGTCLDIQLPDGTHLAGLVTFHVIEKPGPGQDTFGINCIAFLDYIEKKPAPLAVFKKRDFAREESTAKVKPWLPIVRSAYSNCQKKSKSTFTPVGSVNLTYDDAIPPRYGVAWDFEKEVEQIRAWRKKKKTKGLLIAQRLDDVPAWQKIAKDIEAILKKGNPKYRRRTLQDEIDLSPLRK